MDILFRSRRLERCFENSTDAIRTWGPQVGRQYVLRLKLLASAERLADFYSFPLLDFHPLTGDRAGQYAVRLTGQVRMILTAQDERTVMIEEVVDYHG